MFQKRCHNGPNPGYNEGRYRNSMLSLAEASVVLAAVCEVVLMWVVEQCVNLQNDEHTEVKQ